MNRRAFLGAVAAALAAATAPAAPTGRRGPYRTLSLFEPVECPGRECISVALDMWGAKSVHPDPTIYEVHAFTVTRHTGPDAATVHLMVKYGEGDTTEAARAAVYERLGREAELLVTRYNPPGRKLWLRSAAKPRVYWSPTRGVWKAWLKSAIVVVPEYYT